MVGTDRKKTFKKATDLDDQRKRREDARVTLRTKQRDEMLQKKRMGSGTMTAEEQSADQIPKLLQMVHSEDAAAQFNATLQFRKLLSIENNPPIDQVIASGVVPKLVEFLHRYEGERERRMEGRERGKKERGKDEG